LLGRARSRLLKSERSIARRKKLAHRMAREISLRRSGRLGAGIRS
jgi:hypothetical protein